MSLVAYCASDDSEDSDAEETKDIQDEPSSAKPQIVPSKGTQNIENGTISDSDSDNEARSGNNLEDNALNNKLRALPEPKHTDIGKGIPETDVLEEEVKPKAAELADAPKPPPKKPKQPVRITIPALNPDSDEEDGPSIKRAKTSNSKQGKSGLFALLPPPQHASIKETNRALIPHTLTKKQPAAPAPKPSTQPSKKEVVGPAKPGQEDSDSDGEDQPSNFFSFGDNDTHTVSGLSSKKLSLPPPMVASEHLVSGVVRPSVNVSQDLAGGSVLGRSVDLQSGVLQFRASYSSTQGVYQPHIAGPIPMETSMAAAEIEQGSDETERQSAPTVPTDEDEFQQLLQSDEFLRMQGKKHRGKESINIVDVNADDFICTVDVHKSMTEEQPERMTHKKGDGPSSQQKRKHQITYLAHQAKEREIELKNEWSNNRMSRKQTQAKYGF
ncbi:proline-rich protein PRCC-like [Crassostrea angulata]|uniref:proline-rich protein PRCC-like n=1 Tax=Magallana angulata TaxID=2784310 RepID=UPI0022B19E16|nr:proline-rich protein PRCC-like [Crassostrea angulata]XP_052696504.1 proline-rich protein PRCC-like [Crassostrea angulata]